MNTKQLHAGDFVTSTVRLVRPLAEGGMGRVWVAEHLGLQAQVVVKLMAPEIAERPDGAERFAREAAVAAAIKSPHVVQVFDHGVTSTGTPYIVMELLEGRDLSLHLAEHGRMSPADVCTLVCQIGKALSKAHRASIIHRDIKPENIFLCETEGGEIFAKLLDFGTARREGNEARRATVPGQIMGTPYYMSPEQSVGAVDINERSDLWSLGVVTFEALTGQRPFEGSSVGAITIAIHGPLPKMTAIVPDLPAGLDDWFARVCAQDPSDRFETVREAMSSLVEAVTGAPLAQEQLTESIHLPEPPHAPAAITSIAPVSSPLACSHVDPPRSLISTLPKRGSERRFTQIAAGVVMTATAVAMAAIVLGRSPAPAERTAPHAADAPARPPAAAVNAPAPEVKLSETSDDKPKSEPAAEVKVETPVPPAPRKAAPASIPRAAKPTRVANRPHSASEGLEDDLVRLTNATAKQVESPAPAEPPAAPRPDTTPAPPLPAP